MLLNTKRTVLTIVPVLILIGLFGLLLRQPTQPVAAQTGGDERPDIPTVQTDRETAAAETELARAVPPVGDLMLPPGVRALRIEVDATGIYEITFAMLRDAGLRPGQIDPATLQMMSRGKAVAYEFIGDDDNRFEQGEVVRFFGWGIENRYERHYVDHNVFWLWAGGTPTRIAPSHNPAGYQPAVSWTSTITFEHDLFFSPTYVRWNNLFENDPDAWYWDFLDFGIEYSYPLTLPNPAADGPPAQYVVELFSRNVYDNSAVAALAGDPTPVTRAWPGKRSVNLNGAVIQAALVDGPNTLAITTGAIGNSDLRFNLNRATVSYARRFVAVDNALLMNYETPGDWQFRINGLPISAPVIAWEVSDRYRPKAVSNVTTNANGQARIGRRIAAEAALELYVTVANNVRQPIATAGYTATPIAPPNNTIEWLAIAYADFMTETQRLADYRATADRISTYVVDIADVTNQYGYGLATPTGIKRLAQTAYDNWGLDYLLLVGDATQNPRHRPCVVPAPACLQRWNDNLDAPNLLVTDFVFEDRFLGLVPSDHTYAMLDGNDAVPDIAVGRLAARTVSEARAMVDKTIRYDTAVRAEEPWLERILFIADNKDAAGDFCLENRDIIEATLPEPYASQVTEQCLDDYLADGQTTAQFRNDLFNHLADIGGPAPTNPGILNYRGHGGIDDWAAGTVRSATHANLWANYDHPVVILSADCLDGHFAWLGTEGLGETFFRLQGDDSRLVGSAAHWGSSGLGYSFEHTVLHREFYHALYRDNALTIGRAINQSKQYYIANNSGSVSEIYTMTLHGDPALRMPQPPEARGLSAVSTTGSAAAEPGSNVVYSVTVTNTGNRFETLQVTTESTWPVQVTPGSIDNLPPGASAVVRLTHRVPAGAVRLIKDSLTVSVRSTADSSIQASVILQTQARYNLETFLPIVRGEDSNER